MLLRALIGGVAFAAGNAFCMLPIYRRRQRQPR